jgi:hypothetical protein
MAYLVNAGMICIHTSSPAEIEQAWRLCASAPDDCLPVEVWCGAQLVRKIFRNSEGALSALTGAELDRTQPDQLL